MDAKVKYQRSFLIFNQEDGGYGSGQTPSGYVKIEARDGKGKLSASVQNLREEQGKLVYKLYILSFDEKGIYPAYAGVIPLQRSKGELNWEFDPQNVAASGKTINTFATAVVLAEYLDRKNTQILCPLAAYKDKKISWREKLKDYIYLKTSGTHGYARDKEEAEQQVLIEDNIKKDADESSFCENEGEQQKYIPEYQEIFNKHDIGIESKYEGEKQISDIDYLKIGMESRQIQEEPYAETKKETEVFIEADKELKESEAKEECDAADLPILETRQEPEDAAVPEDNTDEKVEFPACEEAEEDDRIKPAEDVPSSFEEYRQLLDKSLNDELYGKSSMNFGGCTAAGNTTCPYQASERSFSKCAECISRISQSQTPGGKNTAVNDLESFKSTLDKYFEVSDPFGSRRKDYKWWKVNSPVYLNNILYQCNIRTPLLFNPVVITANYKYRHLIVGIYMDKARAREYIACGIPGVYGIDEKPFGDMCRWVQLEGTKPKYGAFGYWLVYIDSKTGKFLALN